MRVRIRRFGTLRFPVQADLSAVVRSSPIVSVPRFAVLSGCTLCFSESSADVRGHLWNTIEIRTIPSPFRSALRIGAVHGPRSPPLLWPLLTSRSAVDNSPRRRPFRHEARSPQRITRCHREASPEKLEAIRIRYRQEPRPNYQWCLCARHPAWSMGAAAASVVTRPPWA